MYHWIYHFPIGPPKCTNITITDISVNYLRLSWDNKSCNVQPSEYEVTWTTAGETFTEIGITATEYTITNLTGCSDYSVTVLPRDRCGAGEGVTMNITTLEGSKFLLTTLQFKLSLKFLNIWK